VHPGAGGYRAGFVTVLGIAMGVQNAAWKDRRSDLTTTVLTLTITGLGADSTWLADRSRAGRRVVAIARC